MDPTMDLIRVGEHIRRMDTSCSTEIQPIVLDPCHAITRPLIKDVDARLLHPGPDRVFAEIRRKYYVLRGSNNGGPTSCLSVDLQAPALLDGSGLLWTIRHQGRAAQ